MNYSQRVSQLALGLALAVALAGCSANRTNDRAIYKSATTLPSLEVPPDLTTPEDHSSMQVPTASAVNATAASAAQGGSATAGQVLPEVKGVTVHRDGQDRWLTVDSSPQALWPKLRNFWQLMGLELKKDEPKVGIMETQWAEKRADVPEGFLRGMLAKLMDKNYSTSMRDKFRVRLERGQRPGTTDVFLSHYGVEQVVKGESDVVWEPRPSDPELANEMLNQLMVYLGVEEGQAKAMAKAAPQAPDRAHLTQLNGADVLVVDEPYAWAWRRVGLALDKVGLVVEDLNREQGVYRVRPAELVKDMEGKDSGWFSSLFSSDDKQGKDLLYRVELKAQGENRTSLMFVGKDDQAYSDAKVKDYLSKLQQELR